jgi:renalase
MITAEKVDVLIVGAGLSGLLAANTLRSLGASLRIVDKGRGVGGRLATRRLGVGGPNETTVRTKIANAP